MKKTLTQIDYLRMIRKPTCRPGDRFSDQTKYNRKVKHKKQFSD